MVKKILITDKVHPILIKNLTDSGCEVTYDTKVDNQILEAIIHQYDGIIINSKIIMNRARIDKGQRIKFIGRLGSGLEIIDVPYAESKGIKVYNSPEGNRNAVAEHEIGMILALMNNIVRADSEVRKFTWNREENRGSEIKGKTIGIIGLGNTGGAFAEKLYNWGAKVISYDKYKTAYADTLDFVEKVSIQQLQYESDIISLHLPLTDETYKMVNHDFLYGCKNDIIISNTSRGQIVDTKTLLYFLQSGKIKGACMDVFENEKPESFSEEERSMYSALYRLPNVVLTQHIAGWTHESLELIATVLFEKIKAGGHIL